VIHWKQIDEFIEPNWEKVVASEPPTLFWRGKKEAAVFGYIRDGELFDYMALRLRLQQGDPFFADQRT